MKSQLNLISDGDLVQVFIAQVCFICIILLDINLEVLYFSCKRNININTIISP